MIQSLKFLFVGPMILTMLGVINYLTSPGVWWIQWPALGIGIAWFFSLLRVARTILLLGGVALIGTYLYKRWEKRNDRARRNWETIPPQRV